MHYFLCLQLSFGWFEFEANHRLACCYFFFVFGTQKKKTTTNVHLLIHLHSTKNIPLLRRYSSFITTRYGFGFCFELKPKSMKNKSKNQIVVQIIQTKKNGTMKKNETTSMRKKNLIIIHSVSFGPP